MIYKHALGVLHEKTGDEAEDVNQRADTCHTRKLR